MPKIEINIGNFKVYSIASTSSLVVGKGSYEQLSSQSKTTNGVGSAYGDGSYINMSPQNSSVNDPDIIDTSKNTVQQSQPSYWYYPWFYYPISYPQQSFYPIFRI
ncbi:hypothetical protein JOC75_000986 [Metabacillus crassostreae]|uniref:spore germination protein n=1 Tax=Metabacillus crassostreae TaxID=929098 RepID=UPI00195E096F|nr:spore germination protein [Metabacillus crassostreae]MBM7603016.1 hypothetical protein [Metabacillus crassostreae]